jgi:hypothetical protein
MRRVIVLLLVLTIVTVTYGEKTKVPLKDYKWYMVSGDYSSVSEFRKAIQDVATIDITSTIIAPNQPVTLYTIIETENDHGNKLFFEMENKQPFPVIMIDGQSINNLRQDVSFTSEILTTGGKDELLLSLVIDSSAIKSETNLATYFEGMFLSYINGIAIVWCEPLKDPFFGGYMIEVHVFNLLQKDIDGKLKAQLSDPNTFDIIAENNNCAFTRSNSEAIIDINFPEAKDKLISGNYTLEIALVDKEKNEEIVDKLIVPIWLN